MAEDELIIVGDDVAHDDDHAPMDASSIQSGSNNPGISWSEFLSFQKEIISQLNNRPLAAPIIIQGPMKLPDFNPDHDDAQSWHSASAIIVSHRKPNTSELAMALTQCLKGNAARWVADVMCDTLTWDTFETLFKLKFCTIDTPAAILHRSINARTSDGNVDKLIAEQLSKIRGAFRGKTADECALIVATALAVRAEPEIKRYAYTHKNLNEVELFQELKAVKGTRQSQGGPSQNKSQPFKQFKRPYNGSQGVEQKKWKPSDRNKNNQEVFNFKANTQTQHLPQQQQQQLKKRWCKNCRMNNHDWEYCRFNPNRKSAKSANGTTPKTDEKRVNACTLNPQGHFNHQGNIHPFIFDSGSECSILSSKLTPLFLGQEYNNPVKLIGIGHGEIIVNTQISTIIQINNIDIPVLFYVVPEEATSHDILLGRDILSAGISVNVLPDRYEVTKIDKHTDKSTNQKLKYLKRNYKPILDKNPLVKTTKNVSDDTCDTDTENETSWQIPCNVPIIDKQVESITATEGPLTRSIIQGSINGQLESEIFRPETETLNTDLTHPEDLVRLRTILQKFSNTFTRGLPKRPVNILEFKITLIDPNKVVYRRPYRLHPRDRDAVRGYVKELLQAGIIEESNSPYSSPILLVPKKNGMMRMCTDFREINSNTLPERYPIPLIQEQLTRLADQNYFIGLDCASGFYGIPTSEESRHILAFSTPDGHYQYRRMPFGVRNAPCCYQRAIVTALGDLANTYCLAYLDDLLIVSRTKEEAFTRLEVVLEVLDKAGFSLNPDKCSFIKQSTIYLGYEVKNGNIRPHNDRIKALTELPPPKDRTALRSFLGLCSYFRNFVPNFSLKCAPLYKLTSIKERFEWTPEHEQIRQEVIQLLTSEPCLTIFKPEYPIEVWCDASSIGYGAILFNIIDGQRKVVGYFSRRTTPAEEKYHSYELETLAAVKSFKHWECFLLYHNFTLITDCKSFQASYVKQNLITRVHRWWAYLQTFVFKIQYRPGSKMQTVDFLSRYPVGEPEKVNVFETQVHDYPPKHLSEDYKIIKSNLTQITDMKHNELIKKKVNLVELSGEWLQVAQQQDPEIKLILDKLDKDLLPHDLAKTYEINEGILYRKFQHKKKNCKAPIVPKFYRWVVVNSIHESILHMGLPKTQDKVLEKFWFPNMNKFIKKFIENCVTCKITKAPSGKKQVQLYPIPKTDIPFDTVHIDITGKLSGSAGTPEYYIVMVCSFTKYVLLHYTRSLTAKAAVNAVSEMTKLFGPPSRLVFDQGTSFTSGIFTEYCEQNNINTHAIATGASRANSQVERYMSSITNLITVAQYIKKQSIRQLLPKIQLVLNSTTNRTTSMSPIELLIGRRPNMPGMITIDEHVSPPTRSNLSNIRTEAKQNIDRLANYELERFIGKGAQIEPLNIGDFCVRQVEPRVSQKTAPKFKGMYQVVEILPHDRYILENLNSKKRVKYPHDRVRRINQDISLLPQLLDEDESESDSDN